MDLCVTRIADLGQDAVRRCKGPETGHDWSSGVEGSANGGSAHRQGDCGDSTTREARYNGVRAQVFSTTRKSWGEQGISRGYEQYTALHSVVLFLNADVQICWTFTQTESSLAAVLRLFCDGCHTSFQKAQMSARFAPFSAGRFFFAAVQAVWGSAVGIENRYSVAAQVMGELPQGLACATGRAHCYAG